MTSPSRKRRDRISGVIALLMALPVIAGGVLLVIYPFDIPLVPSWVAGVALLIGGAVQVVGGADSIRWAGRID